MHKLSSASIIQYIRKHTEKDLTFCCTRACLFSMSLCSAAALALISSSCQQTSKWQQFIAKIYYNMIGLCCKKTFYHSSVIISNKSVRSNLYSAITANNLEQTF